METPIWRSTFALSFAGSGLLWAAFAPLQWTWLAWLAPIPWGVLIRLGQLPGRRPYLAIWASSLMFWLAYLQGIRLAHPANYLGWLALSSYLAVYLPAFVGLARLAVHRFGIPLVVTLPVIWTGLELLRGRILTGFAMGLLAHTQVEWTSLIQIADVGGAYLVSFLIMLVAACAARMIRLQGRPAAIWPLAPLLAAISVALAYGQFRLATAPAHEAGASPTSAAVDSSPTGLRVALIQRVIDTKFAANASQQVDAFEQYWQATVKTREADPELDLIVWPESVFSENNPEVQCDEDFFLPPDIPLTREEFTNRFRARRANFDDKVERVAQRTNQLWRDGDFETLDIHLLVGTETIRFGADRMHIYNSALLIDPQGTLAGRYYKMHPVMFGEYIPFGDQLPLIYQYTPMHQGITPGRQAEAFQVAGLTMAPSICFESTVPHLIRRQVVELTERDTSPDVLVNVTHDGWFFGSSILEHQFSATVFRAVELRRPVLVAANAGISCWIDGSGIIRDRGPRRGNGVIIADVRPDGRWSGYQAWGDLPAGLCLVTCLLLLAAQWFRPAIGSSPSGAAGAASGVDPRRAAQRE